MRYIVVVKAEATIERVVVVEAATEKEAGHSAYQLVSEENAIVPGSFEVVSVKHDETPERTAPGRHFEGYVRRLL